MFIVYDPPGSCMSEEYFCEKKLFFCCIFSCPAANHEEPTVAPQLFLLSDRALQPPRPYGFLFWTCFQQSLIPEGHCILHTCLTGLVLLLTPPSGAQADLWIPELRHHQGKIFCKVFQFGVFWFSSLGVLVGNYNMFWSSVIQWQLLKISLYDSLSITAIYYIQRRQLKWLFQVALINFKPHIITTRSLNLWGFSLNLTSFSVIFALFFL